MYSICKQCNSRSVRCICAVQSSLDSYTHVCVNTLYLAFPIFARLSSRLGNSVAEMRFFFFLWNLEVIACLAMFVQVDILLCIIIVNRNML